MSPFDEHTTTHTEQSGSTSPLTDGSTSPPLFRDQAADLKDKAVRGARSLADTAQSEARSRIDRGKSTAATTLTNVATTLMDSGAQLRNTEEAVAGEYIERFARGVDRAAQYMQRADVREITNDIEEFARKRPALFVGTAFAAGLIAGRLMKSSGGSTPRANVPTATGPTADGPATDGLAAEPWRPEAEQPTSWQSDMAPSTSDGEFRGAP